MCYILTVLVYCLTYYTDTVVTTVLQPDSVSTLPQYTDTVGTIVLQLDSVGILPQYTDTELYS